MGDSRPLDRDLRAPIRWDLNLILCIHCGSGGQDLLVRDIGGAGHRSSSPAAAQRRSSPEYAVSGPPGVKSAGV